MMDKDQRASAPSSGMDGRRRAPRHRAAKSRTPRGPNHKHNAASIAAQTPEPTFEVATVKPADPSTDDHTHINYPPGGIFSAINITLPALMEWAYNMPEKQIRDVPSRFEAARFDIRAKSHANLDLQLRSLPSEQEQDTKRKMVQALLADRFSLKLHQETRILAANDLVLAKGGSKLQLTHSNGKSIATGRNYLNGRGLTISIIAETLSEITGRVVVAKTGLPDRYDLKLEWTPDNSADTNASAPSLFTAIQEQLGLKLESAKESVPVLVVDHIEQPSAN